MRKDRVVIEPMEDAEFEAYIGRHSRLSNHYRDLKSELPPKDLDEAVLSLARSAHSLKRPEQAGRELYIGWMAPVAFAATVVLVFTVVLQIVIRPQLMQRNVSEIDRPAAPASPAAGPAADVVSPLTDRTSTEKIAAPKPAAQNVTESLAVPPRREAGQAKLAEKITVTVQRSAAAAQTASPVTALERLRTDAPATDSTDLNRDPAAWLAEIEGLRRAGQAEAADQQMKHFLEKYPDYFRTHAPPPESR
jgi:hypothetical protein